MLYALNKSRDAKSCVSTGLTPSLSYLTGIFFIPLTACHSGAESE